MKYFLFLSIMFLFHFGFSQSKIDDKSPILKGIKVESVQDSKLSFINNAKITWDFSTLNLNKKNVSIEVVTIYDCFNGENASDFKETIKVLNKENFTTKGTRDLIHVQVGAKCFKWRVVVAENNETKVSNWSYFSFLK